MWTCGKGFTHKIAEQKKNEHILITRGIYKIIRHPSYLGWWLFNIGLQMILKNRLCLILSVVIPIRFFSKRIRYEEMKLIEFFGDEYIEYKQKTWCGIPFCN